ncbi:MAG: rubrerythrin [Oryzomonas sp.]|uniref:rubrerythrin n=1 Tax=Oryzomonas sp. TaxID=2855186 RepID=UPI00283C9941|nr:rubrerythrin [Oryzomonas sp.]MDR3581622.1 rubrerythrin [Oryzomonas sp.]
MSDFKKLPVSDLNVLRICAEIEEECAGIYWYFSGLFGHDERIAALWHKTAREEENHSSQFKLAQRLQGSGMSAVNTDADKASHILGRIKSINVSVKNSPLSLHDALKLAIDIEERLSEFHASELVEFSDEKICELFASMKECDREHTEMLKREYAELVKNV